MAWYIRTAGRVEDAVPYARLEDAIQQCAQTVDMHTRAGKRVSRTADGKIELHEPDGSLFEVIWIENEDGRVMRF